jgi:leukotriene-A4 hydrolase
MIISQVTTVVALGLGIVIGGEFRRVDAMPDEPTARIDVHSYGRPGVVAVRHVDLTLKVDFAAKSLIGSALLTVERKSPGPLILDTRDLTIERVEAGADPKSLAVTTYTLKPADPILGSALEVTLPEGAKYARITYKTAPTASALQWLDPPRTAGGKKPFLFSQSEAIHARSWIPLQDSPGVRVTYRATIFVPRGMVAVMSADLTEVEGGGGADKEHVFEMKEAIPSYLIALAVGDLEFRPLGKRTGVWAEPSVVEKAAREFVDTEKMVAVAEARFGPYRWGRYDILVLPPSFPFGGMENPRLTFATPTIIAGDRSLVSLIAHELAHSWSGNLVTNATWRDFWLNEGFTTYIERRIVEDLYGPQTAAIEALLGLEDLKEEIASQKAADQILHVDLAGRDPDEGMTRVAYEKGALFLTTLEKAFGRETFDKFLRDYFDAHAFQSILTADFVADLKAKLFPTNPKAAASIDLDAWIEQPGLKAPYEVPVSPRLEAVDRAAKAFAAGSKAGSLATSEWTTHEWLRFLRGLPERLTAAQMADLDAAFGLTKRGNAEIADVWLLIAVRNDYTPAYPRLEEFLTTIGRRKFLMPLYKELVKTDPGKARARSIYAKARPFYHPITIDSVDKVVGKP